MITPEEAVRQVLLIHGTTEADTYDPVKAREYYLRTRQLKGRGSGGGRTSTGRPSAKGEISARLARQAQAAQTQRRAKAASNRKAVEAKVAALQVRMGALQNLLKDLVAQKGEAQAKATEKAAKDSSGSKTSSGSKASTDRKPLTAKQKSDAAKRSKEHYEENKQPAIKKLKGKELDDKITEVRSKITQMRGEIAAARQTLQSSKPIHTAPDKKGRKPGDPEYGND